MDRPLRARTPDADGAWRWQLWDEEEGAHVERMPSVLLAAVLSLLLLLTASCVRGAAELTPAQVSSNPPAEGFLSLLDAGSRLPSEDECTARVRRSSWEPRPSNYLANNRVPWPRPALRLWPGVAERARPLLDRVSGQRRGTTDELIQWASCNGAPPMTWSGRS